MGAKRKTFQVGLYHAGVSLNCPSFLTPILGPSAISFGLSHKMNCITNRRLILCLVQPWKSFCCSCVLHMFPFESGVCILEPFRSTSPKSIGLSSLKNKMDKRQVVPKWSNRSGKNWQMIAWQHVSKPWVHCVPKSLD